MSSDTPGSPEQELADLKEKIRSNVTAASAMLGLPYGMSIEDFCEAVSQLSPSSETGERHRVHDEAWYKAPPKLNLSISCGNCGWCESRLKCPNCGAKK